MKGRSRFLYLIAGLLIGAAVSGSAAVAAGVTAHPKTADVVIDGRAVDLKGYIIDGSHYFQLRSLAAALGQSGKDFGVEWNGANNRVLIDTSRGYDPGAAPPSRNGAAAGQAMTVDEMKAEIIRLTNTERANAGLPELKALPELMDCAQAKADDMLRNGYYGHTSPVYGTSGKMIRSFVPNAGWCGENLAPWTKTPEEAFAGWRDSPGHLENIVFPQFTHIGIGIIEGAGGGYWWVQQFAQLQG